MDAHELNRRLTDQGETFLKHLFPMGKKVGGEYVVGSLAGEAGDSLKIRMGGAKKGFWSDFAGDKKGRSLLGLWAEVLGSDYAKACRSAKEYLGVRDDFARRFMPAEKPKAPPKVERGQIRALQPAGAVMDYLVNDRKLDPFTLDAYTVAESADGQAVVFPFFATEETDEKEIRLAGSACFVKFMALYRAEGKKKIWTQPAGVPDVLFGKNALANAAFAKLAVKGVLVITEGELDAMSVATWGYHGVSVPRGAKHATADGQSANDQWLREDFEWLAQFERIYLWFDADEPGEKAARDVAQRVGLERAYLVKTPRGLKDANECLCAGVEVPEIQEAFESAQTMDPANLQWGSAFMEKVLRRLFPPGGVEPGLELPWPFPWRLRPGEMTAWTGFDGHGKTVCLSQLMVHAAGLGQRVCVASMEMQPDQTLETMWCQANGRRMPLTRDELQEWPLEKRVEIGTARFYERYPWVGERVLIFLPEVDAIGVGRADWREMLKCFVYARQRYGCEQFVIDSLMMCVGRGEEDYREVELLVNAMAAFAKRHQVHVHLVAHARKRDDEFKPPGKQDIAGPKETSGISDNVCVVQRNMKKKKRLDELEHDYEKKKAVRYDTEEARTEQAAELGQMQKEMQAARLWHDGELHLVKQRHGAGELGSKYLFFLNGARQFVLESPLLEGARTDRNSARQYLSVEAGPAVHQPSSWTPPT